jgi:hypothetical protein
MEPETLLWCSQEPSTGSNPEPDESNAYRLILFLEMGQDENKILCKIPAEFGFVLRWSKFPKLSERNYHIGAASTLSCSLFFCFIHSFKDNPLML